MSVSLQESRPSRRAKYLLKIPRLAAMSKSQRRGEDHSLRRISSLVITPTNTFAGLLFLEQDGKMQKLAMQPDATPALRNSRARGGLKRQREDTPEEILHFLPHSFSQG